MPEPTLGTAKQSRQRPSRTRPAILRRRGIAQMTLHPWSSKRVCCTARHGRLGRVRSASTADRLTLASGSDCESADVVVPHDCRPSIAGASRTSAGAPAPMSDGYFRPRLLAGEGECRLRGGVAVGRRSLDDRFEPVDVGVLGGLALVDRVLRERGEVTGFGGDRDVNRKRKVRHFSLPGVTRCAGCRGHGGRGGR